MRIPFSAVYFYYFGYLYSSTVGLFCGYYRYELHTKFSRRLATNLRTGGNALKESDLNESDGDDPGDVVERATKRLRFMLTTDKSKRGKFINYKIFSAVISCHFSLLHSLISDDY